MAGTIDPTVQAAIQQAVDDQAAAATADSQDATAVQAVQAAQAIESGAKATSLAAHQTALASATTAIQALAKELGYTLPAPAPVVTPTARLR